MIVPPASGSIRMIIKFVTRRMAETNTAKANNGAIWHAAQVCAIHSPAASAI